VDEPKVHRPYITQNGIVQKHKFVELHKIQRIKDFTKNSQLAEIGKNFKPELYSIWICAKLPIGRNA
jgi:hypothetical protein